MYDGDANFNFVFQVTKDGCPVIFHDNFIFTEQDVSSKLPINISLHKNDKERTNSMLCLTKPNSQGEISGKRVTDLRLDEFLCYGPQKDQDKVPNRTTSTTICNMIQQSSEYITAISK
jgi:hypothetical protein